MVRGTAVGFDVHMPIERFRLMWEATNDALEWVAPTPKNAPDSRLFRDERFIAVVRALGGLITLPLVPFLHTQNPEWTYATIVFALLYNLVFLLVLIPR